MGLLADTLLDEVSLPAAITARLAADYERFAERELPLPLGSYVLEQYGVDISSEYGGAPIHNPFGKASGQLSLNLSQVQRDARAGLGFVVLKTIIAEDSSGEQSMSEWAIPETRMQVERIIGRRPGVEGREGWTVTWKGRGWYGTFDSYLDLFADALDAGRATGMVIAPSCKYHLPSHAGEEWRREEYDYTTGRLLDVWQRHGWGQVMPLEKDFSPTLAGSDRAGQKSTIMRWLHCVTGLIRQAACGRPVSIGVKVLNAMFDDAFQVDMLKALADCTGGNRPEFVVYANRLFDPDKRFNGATGVAYGGPDLSARNLDCLAALRAAELRGDCPRFAYPISATGAIDCGRTALLYLLRGASSFQMHTCFQLNDSEFRRKGGNKTECVLHEFCFHPERGLIAGLLRLRQGLSLAADWNIARIAAFCAEPANRLWADYPVEAAASERRP